MFSMSGCKCGVEELRLWHGDSLTGEGGVNLRPVEEGRGVNGREAVLLTECRKLGDLTSKYVLLLVLLQLFIDG